ncbi:nucleolar protein viriato isoform X4 [Lasioglossum baleicum]|uniref:nucleolar protein viriato isoform X4 n=1 Tax=Lasioglossum baleicum TaxID=434251 RepID=UPI003FCD822B
MRRGPPDLEPGTLVKPPADIFVPKIHENRKLCQIKYHDTTRITNLQSIQGFSSVPVVQRRRRFHKRKVQRQKKAQEELQQQLKEERKKIKQEARERYKNLVSSRDIPEIQQLLSQQEYETQGHTVSILELNVADLAEKDAFIGENEGLNEEEDEEEEENNENSENDEEIVGMTLNKKKQVKTSKPNSKDKTVGTRKDIKREIKKAALKHVQKSKAFQQKQNLERNKNKKESMRKLKRAQKAQKRSGKFKKTANR